MVVYVSICAQSDPEMADFRPSMRQFDLHQGQRERRERFLVGRVGALRGVDVEAARARVEDAVEALVENHLRELVLDLGQRQLHELRDVARLHLGVLGVGC